MNLKTRKWRIILEKAGYSHPADPAGKTPTFNDAPVKEIVRFIMEQRVVTLHKRRRVVAVRLRDNERLALIEIVNGATHAQIAAMIKRHRSRVSGLISAGMRKVRALYGKGAEYGYNESLVKRFI